MAWFVYGFWILVGMIACIFWYAVGHSDGYKSGYARSYKDGDAKLVKEIV